MFSVDLSIRECGGGVVVGLPGELDVADAVSVATSLAALAAGRRYDTSVRRKSGYSPAAVGDGGHLSAGVPMIILRHNPAHYRLRC